MTITTEHIRALFAGLEQGNGAAFFAHVADDVDWTVEGTHPLAGHYRSKAAFMNHTFGKLSKVLMRGAQLHITDLLVSGDWAVVELRSTATAKNGFRFDNRYCWVTRFEDGRIVEARAYLDSAMVQRLFDENPL